MSIIILIIAISMSMVGKGGGNFYVLAMVLAGVSMQNAATTSQLIMMGTSLSAMLIFSKHKKIDWKLALIIDPPTDIMAFVGGYYAGNMEGTTLKLMFAILLIIISVFMLIPIKEKPNEQKNKFGYWNRTFGNYKYTVNLWITIPITATVGFFAGAIGISGGAFKIPLMVMLCGIPMEIAVGTSSAMVTATALMGFIGHSIHGDFNPQLAIPLTIVAVIGGIVGSKYAVKSKPKNLKKIFVLTNLLAAVMMIINIYK
ncbi:sulfite exporter TauE/SafE family protein [Clostridium sp.]|uniref:sulfite exporter TauE/SafE family protein n=1 Tax=Clostridium sp. TaxID=1506 RepID=UPI003D6D0C08